MRSKHSGGYWVEQAEKRKAQGKYGTGETDKPNTHYDTRSIAEKWYGKIGGTGQRGKQIERILKEKMGK